MKVFLQNFGCKVNQIETESLGALLTAHGWEISREPDGADAVVINSCTVTASGDHRMLTALRRFRKQLPHAVIAVTGCYVQAFPEAPLPEADICIGTKERRLLPVLLEEFLLNRLSMRHVPVHHAGEDFEQLPLGTDPGHTRAFLKIQDGCNRFCTYCIIPYARGRCRSLPLKALGEQAERLAAEGFREIVLCGINLACYGEDEGLTIADAAEVCAAAGFPRVRLGSLEPDGLTDAVLERLAENPAFCPQFHISLQSGCDRTLRAMGRHYTCGDYAALLQNIRRLFPDGAVTTDIMTGFPAETDEDFAETLRFAEEMAFAKIHIFRYSRRPGTAADRMDGHISEGVKKKRADALAAVEKQSAEACLTARIGAVEEVLFEREKQGDFHCGHTRSGMDVRVPKTAEEGSLRNEIRRVNITAVRDGLLLGTLLPDTSA